VNTKFPKKSAALLAVAVLLNGCMPGLYISRKEPSAQGQPVEFRLGNPVEISEWRSLQKQVCEDLEAATEGLPANERRDIYKYSCVEPNRHALGETLARLQPGQIDDLCTRLSQKGYIVKKDEIPTSASEMGIAFLVLIGSMALVISLSGGI
jgi:hypothetical protein